MNNEEFRKLLNSGGTAQGRSKTTKEIAREAVESEFRAKGRKRGRDDDYLSDEDYDEDDGGATSTSRREKARKKKQEEELALEKEKEEELAQKKAKKQKYRNRARERREGKSNVDYNDSKDISAVDAEMNQYLGGDEAYTHLVKGLDKALAEKVRRDEVGKPSLSGRQQEDDIDLDQIMEEATAKSKASKLSKTDAHANTLENLEGKSYSALGTGMIDYLRHIKEQQQMQQTLNTSLRHRNVQPSQAGEAILRSTLLFSTTANIHDRLRSWELPKETTMSIAQYERLRGGRRKTCTPLDINLIEKIDAALSSQARRTHQKTIKVRAEIALKEKSEEMQKKNNSGRDEIDSDDDIFGDIGEYIPPSAAVALPSTRE